MRVLHLIDHLGIGGAQRVLLDLLECSRPGEAEVLSLRERCEPAARERMKAVGVRYESLGLSWRRAHAVRALRRAIARRAPDVLHTHLEWSDMLGGLAALGLGRSRPLLVHHIHNDPGQEYARIHRLAGRLLARRADALVVPSARVEDAVRRAFRGPLHAVAVVPYGIDPSRFERRDHPESAALRGDARFVVGSVGRLVPAKATHLLLRATPRLLAEEPRTRVLIVGSGPREESLAAEARRLGVADAVAFVGVVDDPAPAYAAMDVYVQPSHHEGQPIALLEAMAAGTPVVGTRVIGISELLIEGEAGLLVPPGDADALASAILRLRADGDLRGALRENAQRLVRRAYGRERMARDVAALYHSLER